VEPAQASVDVELVALWVFHPHRVVIEAVGAQGSGERGPGIGQPPGLGIGSLHAGSERNRTVLAWPAAAADVDVEVEAVLDQLGVRTTWSQMRGPSQLTVGSPMSGRQSSQVANPSNPQVTRGGLAGMARLGQRDGH
jgi:hypothetical protein